MELCVQKTVTPSSKMSAYEYKKVWWCSRNGRQGKTYSKKLGDNSCPCRLIIHKISNSPFLSVSYAMKHSHPNGKLNIKFMKLSKKARNIVTEYARENIQIDYVVGSLESDFSLHARVKLTKGGINGRKRT